MVGMFLPFSPCEHSNARLVVSSYLHSKKVVLEPVAENLVTPAGHLSFSAAGELVIGEARKSKIKS